MANPVKYSDSTPSNAIRKGQVAIGIDGINYGPTAETGWYAGSTESSYYQIYEVVAPDQAPRVYSPLNSGELINLVNGKGGNVSTEAQAFVWIDSQPNWAIEDSTPSIVTDGLILYLDAGNRSSYPTTDTTWYDLSGAEYNFSLINGITYDNNSLYWNGVNSIAGPTSVPVNTAGGAYNTVSFFMKWEGNSGGFPFEFGGYRLWTPAQWFGFNHGAGDLYGFDGNTNGIINKWVHVVAIFYNGNYSNNSIYINGVSKSLSYLYQTNQSATVGYNLAIGGYQGSLTAYPFKGRINKFQVYNKSLSQSEIFQNYYNGPIVTDGLVFAIDAGNLVSYESGTSVLDLTGNNLPGSLNNGTIIEGEWFKFDGVNDEIEFPANNVYKNQNLSLEFWVNYEYEAGGRGVSFTTWYGFTIEMNNQNASYGTITFGLAGLPNQYFGSPTVEYGKPYLVHCNYDSTTGVQNIYVNGQLAATQTVFGVITYSGAALFFSGSWDRAKGKMGFMKIYNRALTSTEVLQNYNAQKVRFGL